MNWKTSTPLVFDSTNYKGSSLVFCRKGKGETNLSLPQIIAAIDRFNNYQLKKMSNGE